MQFTHSYKVDSLIEIVDIRPEAISKSANKRIANNFENRSCGDTFAWKDGETGILLGMNKNGFLEFLSSIDGVFIEYKGDVNEATPIYLKVPKQEIKWHSIKETKAAEKEDIPAKPKPKTEKKNKPSTKIEQSSKEFSMQYTHSHKSNNGDIYKYDIQPEAIANNASKKIRDEFKNRSCGDVFYCRDNKIRALMGIDERGNLAFVSKFDNTLSMYDGILFSKPPTYLKELPKQEIKWHSFNPPKEPEKKDESAPQTKKSDDYLAVFSGTNNKPNAPKRKRKDFELEINSDEDVGEIKFVKSSDKRIYGFPSGGL